jgi:LytS/YehU family sensor histidine kinase
MQAQVEPHFLFNTLASVQFLTETDPPKAGKMLAHLLEYLRAALPQLRSDSTTLGQETDLAQAYLSIMQMRMGPRLSFAIDVPGELRSHHLPPMMLMSLVENAIKHGLEPRAEGGTVRVEASTGNRRRSRSSTTARSRRQDRNGVGSPICARLKVLYADQARFMLEEVILVPRSHRDAQ